MVHIVYAAECILRETLDQVWERPGSRPRAGNLIVFCGPDGAGKTTQLQLMKKWLQSKGRRVVTTKQPADWYRQEPLLRSFLSDDMPDPDGLSLALLAAADCRQHIIKTIIPALNDGLDVICDRYIYSAFAIFAERGVDPTLIARVNPHIPKPDLALYLSVPPHSLMQRLKSRNDGLKIQEEKETASLDRINGSFRKICSIDDRLALLDGIAPMHQLHMKITEMFEQVHRQKLHELKACKLS